MSPIPSITLLPIEILHNVFSYLVCGKPSDHLATGKIDQSFRALIFTCHSIYRLASDYYYNETTFKCTASELVWELIHMNPDHRAIQAFSNCIARIQRLEVEIELFGTGTIDWVRAPIPIRSLGQIDLQIADLESLRSCLERCKRWSKSPSMKTLALISSGCSYEQYFVQTAFNSPISEQSMYLAVFKPLEKKVGILYVEHRSRSGEVAGL